MLYIRVELWPGGDGKARRCLAEGVIVNDGSGGFEIGNYSAGFSREGGFNKLDRAESIAKYSKVEDFPRRVLGAWHLLARALKAAGFAE